MGGVPLECWAEFEPWVVSDRPPATTQLWLNADANARHSADSEPLQKNRKQTEVTSHQLEAKIKYSPLKCQFEQRCYAELTDQWLDTFFWGHNWTFSPKDLSHNFSEKWMKREKSWHTPAVSQSQAAGWYANDISILTDLFQRSLRSASRRLTSTGDAAIRRWTGLPFQQRGVCYSGNVS